MSKQFTVLLAVILLVASIATFLPTKAENKTIVVPDDYPTISEAIANARDGDIIRLKEGVHYGPLYQTLVIDKSISLIGEGKDNTTLNLTPRLVVIEPPPNLPPDLEVFYSYSFYDLAMNVTADNFRLSDLTVNVLDKDKNIKVGGGINGISIKGNGTQIVSNKITTDLSVGGNWCVMAENDLLGNVGAGGLFFSILKNTFSGMLQMTGSYLNVSSNKYVDCGIRAECSHSLISDNIFQLSNVDTAIAVDGEANYVFKNMIDSAAIGIDIGGTANVVYGNKVTNCLDMAFCPGYPPPPRGIALEVDGNNTVYGNYIAGNTWGVNVNEREPNGNSTFYHNTFIDNMHQVGTDNLYNEWTNQNVYTYGNDTFDNGLEGNYWTDYNGTDADGDGIGDTPYIIDAHRMDRYPLMAPYDIDSIPIELPAWTNPTPSSSWEIEPNSTLLFALIVVAAAAAALIAALVIHAKRT